MPKFKSKISGRIVCCPHCKSEEDLAMKRKFPTHDQYICKRCKMDALFLKDELEELK